MGQAPFRVHFGAVADSTCVDSCSAKGQSVFLLRKDYHVFVQVLPVYVPPRYQSLMNRFQSLRLCVALFVHDPVSDLYALLLLWMWK